MFPEKGAVEEPRGEYALSDTHHHKAIVGKHVINDIKPEQACAGGKNKGACHAGNGNHGHKGAPPDAELVDNRGGKGLDNRYGGRNTCNKKAEEEYGPKEPASRHEAYCLGIGHERKPYTLGHNLRELLSLGNRHESKHGKHAKACKKRVSAVYKRGEYGVSGNIRLTRQVACVCYHYSKTEAQREEYLAVRVYPHLWRENL